MVFLSKIYISRVHKNKNQNGGGHILITYAMNKRKMCTQNKPETVLLCTCDKPVVQ